MTVERRELEALISEAWAREGGGQHWLANEIMARVVMPDEDPFPKQHERALGMLLGAEAALRKHEQVLAAITTECARMNEVADLDDEYDQGALDMAHRVEHLMGLR